MSDGIDQAGIVAELEAELLKGIDGAGRTEGRRLLDQLVADWAREANSHSEPEAVTREQRKDLAEAMQATKGSERLVGLRQALLKRQIRRLSAQSFELGEKILGGQVSREKAPEEGRPLLRAAEQLAQELDELPATDERRRLRRDLENALMEALFAVEGGAMSARLSRAKGASARPDGDEGGPPRVRP